MTEWCNRPLTLLDLVGEQSQSDLAQALRVDRTNLVGLLNDLETADLIERRRSQHDRRRHTVSLTPAGTRRLADVRNALGAAEQRVLSALTPSSKPHSTHCSSRSPRPGAASSRKLPSAQNTPTPNHLQLNTAC